MLVTPPGCGRLVGVDMAEDSPRPPERRTPRARRRVTRQCECCGAEFETWLSKDSRLCSRKCHYAFRKALLRETRKCEGCDKTFETYPSVDKRYCSADCRWITFRANKGNPAPAYRTTPPMRRQRPPVVRECRFCSQSFTPSSANQRACPTCTDGADRSALARLRRYGISALEWHQIQAKYNGMCWICRERPGDNVDHCHETGKVRGALCRACNMALHYVEHPDWLATAFAYLGR